MADETPPIVPSTELVKPVDIVVTLPAGVDPDTYIPTTYIGHPIPPNKFCRGWNAKREKYCGNDAGLGTPSTVGRCKFHGGIMDGDGRLNYHRYSHRLKERYAKLVEEFAQDEDPLNLLPEIDVLRALFVDFIDRYDEYTEALLAWHNSFGKEGDDRPKKPRKVMDIADAHRILDSLGKMVERIRTRKVITVISPEIQDRLRTQISVIGRREKWTSAELLEALDAVWQ